MADGSCVMTDKRKRKLNWFYIPAVILMIAFIAYPLGNAIYLSFFKWNGYSVNKEFVGIENYVSMFKDKGFMVLDVRFFSRLLGWHWLCF